MTTMNRQQAVEVLVALLDSPTRKFLTPKEEQAIAALRDEAGEDVAAFRCWPPGDNRPHDWVDKSRLSEVPDFEKMGYRIEYAYTRPAPQPDDDMVKLCHDGIPCPRVYQPEGGVTEAMVEAGGFAVATVRAEQIAGCKYSYWRKRKDDCRAIARAVLEATRSE